MYISFVTICILIAIVVFCWFKKPAKTVANEVAETVEISADIIHSGLSQLRDQVELASITSSVKNTMEVMTILQEHKDLVEKGITVHSLYQGFMASKVDYTVGEKGKPLTEAQKKAILKTQFMSVLNDLAPQTEVQPQSQPTVKPSTPDNNVEIFG